MGKERHTTQLLKQFFLWICGTNICHCTEMLSLYSYKGFVWRRCEVKAESFKSAAEQAKPNLIVINQAELRLQKVLSINECRSPFTTCWSLKVISGKTSMHARIHTVAESLNATVEHFKSLTSSLFVCTRAWTTTRLVCRAGVDVRCPTATYWLTGDLLPLPPHSRRREHTLLCVFRHVWNYYTIKHHIHYESHDARTENAPKKCKARIKYNSTTYVTKLKTTCRH